VGISEKKNDVLALADPAIILRREMTVILRREMTVIQIERERERERDVDNPANALKNLCRC